MSAAEPAQLRRRPHWGRYPIPWVVWVDDEGTPDFRVHIEERRYSVARERLCQLCGLPLGEEVVFIGFPRALDTLLFGEPPMHRECLDYTLDICPWLGGRHYARRPGSPGTSFIVGAAESVYMVVYTCQEFEGVADPSGMTELVYRAGPHTKPWEWIRRPQLTVS